MARPLRIEFKGAWYHVMNRGAGRKTVFRNDQQRAYFLSLLAQVSERFNAEFHAYCLMPNHYHLMLRTPEGNLQRIMRHVNGLYTQYFNRMENSDGQLFRGRYKATLVDADSYALQLSAYIHRNPIDGKKPLVGALEDYAWSSYPAYLGNVETPAWLRTGFVLSLAATKDQQARYQTFVEQEPPNELNRFYSAKKQSPVLGDDAFKQKVVEGNKQVYDLPELKRLVRPDLQQVKAAVCKHFEVNEKVLMTPTRGKGVKSPARVVCMYLAQELCGMTLSVIAEHFELKSYASAGSTIRTVRQRLVDELELKSAVEVIKQDLTLGGEKSAAKSKTNAKPQSKQKAKPKTKAKVKAAPSKKPVTKKKTIKQDLTPEKEGGEQLDLFSF